MRIALKILGGALLLLLPAILNGAPFLFFDSGEYLRLGRAILAGFRDFQGDHLWLTFLGGRAITYSILLVAAVKVGTIWLPAILQALCGAFVFYRLLVVALGDRTRLFYFPFIAFLSLFSVCGLFVNFLMPDIFCAYSIIIVFILLMDRQELKYGSKIGLWLLLVFSISVHPTNFVLSAITLGLGLLAQRVVGGVRFPLAFRAGWSSFVAIAAALAIVFIASFVVRVGAGEPLRKPPYLMARVLADGPGRNYVRRDCAQTQYNICKYRNKPLDNNDTILWSPNPAVSVMFTAGYAERVKLSEQEMPFVLSAVSRYPVEQLRAAVVNSAMQLVEVDAKDQMSGTKDRWDRILGPGIPNSDRFVRRSLDYRGLWDWSIVTLVHRAVLILAGLGIMWRLFQRDFRQAVRAQIGARSADDLHRLVAIAAIAIVIALLLANAVLCGALSGPSARYQARLIWLIPAAFFLLYARFGWRRSGAA